MAKKKQCFPCVYVFMNTDGVWISFERPKPLQDAIVAGVDPLSDACRRHISRKSWKAYRRLVWKLTNLQPVSTLENHHLRGFHNYHLDHKVSIWYGWKNNIPADQIADISNLRFIPWMENMRKGVRCA